MLFKINESLREFFIGNLGKRDKTSAFTRNHATCHTIVPKQLSIPRCGLVLLALLAQGMILLGFAAPANAQPINPASASGPFTGGGLTISAADLQRLAAGLPPHDVHVQNEGTAAGRRVQPENPESTSITPRLGSSPTIPPLPPSPTPRGGSGRVLLVECNGAYGYATIQSAIDDAVDGDVVVVLPNDCTPKGRWFENINFLGKAIRVQSANPQDDAVVDATVIDGNAAGPVVIFRNDETHSSVIDGLSITNGAVDQFATIYQANRGAIVVGQSNPTIRRCLFFDNDLSAINQVGPSPDSIIVDQCRFIGNAAGIGTTAQTFVAEMIVSNCYFVENLVAIAAQSAPIVLQDSIFENHDSPDLFFIAVTSARTENCTFRNNVAREAILYSSGPVLNSTFEENSARNILLTSTYPDNEDRVVSGCYFRFNNTSSATVASTDTDVTDCVFHSNESLRIGGLSVYSANRSNVVDRCMFINNSGGFFSGGITNLGESIVRNSIFVANRSDSAAGAIASIDFETLVQNSTIIGNASNGPTGGVENVTLENCVVYNNRGAGGVEDQTAQLAPGTVANYCNIQNFSGLCTEQDAPLVSVGNFDLDPRFVDPGAWDDMGTPTDPSDDIFIPGDYHLLPDSPCIDAGDPNFLPNADATDIDGEARLQSCRVDIGADEFTQDDVAVPGDFDGDGIVGLADVPEFLSVALGPVGSQVCQGDLTGDGRFDGRDIAALTALLIGN